MATLHGIRAFSSGAATFLIFPEFSPCGQYLSCGSEDGTIFIWSVQYGILLQKLTGHTNMVNFTAWHPTLPLLISGSDDQTLRLWDAREGTSLSL